jgi:NTP pyrophosphatase (non-canonical NTP hydrolase)
MNYAAENFIFNFMQVQMYAAEINHKSGFDKPDLLIAEFERYLASLGEPSLMRRRFSPLIDMFKQARAGQKLMLTTGELSETLEAVRRNLGPDEHIPAFTSEEAEVADAIIRLMNYATERKLRLAEAIISKMEFNKTRYDHSETGRAEVHGKQF